MKLKIPRAAAVMLLLLVIGGCNTEQKTAPAAGTASGEVLPGSASDAMLPYDSVRSQPPMAEKEVERDLEADRPSPDRASKPKVADVTSAEPAPQEAMTTEITPDAE